MHAHTLARALSISRLPPHHAPTPHFGSPLQQPHLLARGPEREPVPLVDEPNPISILLEPLPVIPRIKDRTGEPAAAADARGRRTGGGGRQEGDRQSVPDRQKVGQIKYKGATKA